MIKEKRERQGEGLASLIEKQPFIEAWCSWWHWAFLFGAGVVPEVKRYYIQFLCFNVAIQFQREGLKI